MSSSHTSFSIQLVQNVSSMQRMMAHEDTQGERQQDEFTTVLDNFQSVGQDTDHAGRAGGNQQVVGQKEIDEAA